MEEHDIKEDEIDTDVVWEGKEGTADDVVFMTEEEERRLIIIATCPVPFPNGIK